MPIEQTPLQTLAPEKLETSGNRVLSRVGVKPQGEDCARNYGSRDVLRGGFRAAFAQYGRSALAAGLMLAHLWRPPRRADPRYYAVWAGNFELLKEALRQ